MNNSILVGIDIGGSHITAALVDLQAHAIIPNSTVRCHVNAKADASQIIHEWTDAIANCKANHSKTSNKIGIAMPGPFDYERGVSLIKGLDKYEALYNINVKELIANRLQIKPQDIVMMNDALCFLKGEVFGGAVQEAKDVIGITLGTGLGSAVFKDNVLHEGDLYYTPYKNATAEDYLSTRWFIKQYHELTGVTAKNVKEIREKVPADETATSLFIEFGNNLGEVLATYIKRHDVEKVVIGGNIIKAWELFIDETEQILDNYSIQVSLVKAKLGEDAALMGAASLCVS